MEAILEYRHHTGANIAALPKNGGQVHRMSAQRLPGAVFCVLKAEHNLKNRNLILFIIFSQCFILTSESEGH